MAGFLAWHSASSFYYLVAPKRGNDVARAFVAAAMACGADLIATRNPKDYAGAPIRAAAPGEVLKILREDGHQ